MAVPPEAWAALIADRPWSRSAMHRQVAERLGLARQYAQAMVGLSGMAGFDVSDPQELAAHGFQAESGIAYFSLAENDSPFLAVGISDAGRAESSLRRVLERAGGISDEATFDLAVTAARSGERITVGTRAGPERIGFLAHGGFLYFRTAGAADPLPALLRIAALGPGEGLGAARDFVECARRAGSGDLVIYASRNATGALPGGSGGVALAIALHADRVQLGFAGKSTLLSTDAEPFAPREPRSDLAADYPAGALAWVRISGSPAALWRALGRVSSPGLQRLREQAGGDPGDEMLHSFSGNFALGIYAGVRGPTVLIAAELERERAGLVEAALDRAAEMLAKRTGLAVQRRTAAGVPVWRLANGSGIFAVAHDKLFLALSDEAGAGPPAGGPPRWPGEATPFDLGALAPLLQPAAGHRSVRDELGSPPAGVRRASRIEVDGGVLDPAGLLHLFLQLQSEKQPGLEKVAAFVREHPALFSKLLLSWRESAEGMEAGLSLRLPAAGPQRTAARVDPLVEALRQARRRVAEQAGDAEAHLDLAELLLKAGAGEAARDEARRAVSPPPAAAAPWVRLGRVLEHDALGRLWHPGFDPQGAEAAFRKAMELDPAAGLELALLLERDAMGERASARSRVPEAVAEIRALRASRKVGHLGLLEAEFFATQWDAVIADAADLPQSEARDAFSLAALAAAQGPAAARSSAQALPHAARRKALQLAARLLEDARLYAAAADLLWEAARDAPNSQELSGHARRLAGVARFEQAKRVAGDPTWTVREALADACDPGVPDQALAHALATDSPIVPRLARSALAPFSAGRRSVLLRGGMGGEHCRDVMYSLAQIRTEGDVVAGFRVEVWPENQPRADLWWLVHEQGGPKILCRGACAPALGARALALIEAGQADPAARVLSWARESIASEGGEADGIASFFISIYEGKPQRLQLAAAVAAAASNRNARALPVLAAALEEEQNAADQARLRVALGRARLLAKDFEGAARMVEGAEQPEALSVRVSALRELHRDAKAVIDDWLRRIPNDPLALWHAMRQASPAHDLPRIEAAARKLIALRKYSVSAQNSLAWAKFCHGKTDDDAIALARAASESGDAGRLNTLAAVYAEAGRMEDALKALFQSVDGRADGAPSAADRYVLARILEGYGLSDLAAAQYRRALAELGTVPGIDADCIAPLARGRLGSLGSP
jgi:hypothetical protein